MSLGLIIFLVTYILPKILPVFTSLKFSLPWSTRTLIFMSSLLTNHSYLSGFLSLFFIITIILCIKNKKINFQLHKHLYLRMPILKNFIRYNFLISFFRSLGLMLQSRVGILNALEIILENEHHYRDQISNLLLHVEKGRSLSTFFKSDTKTFTKFSEQFLIVGERTGTLSNSCLYFSEYIEFELNNTLDKCIKLFEPILMLIVGFLVDICSLALISPLYGMSRISSCLNYLSQSRLIL